MYEGGRSEGKFAVTPGLIANPRAVGNSDTIGLPTGQMGYSGDFLFRMAVPVFGINEMP